MYEEKHSCYEGRSLQPGWEVPNIFVSVRADGVVGFFLRGSRFIVQRQYVPMLHITRAERLVGCQLGTPFRDSKA